MGAQTTAHHSQHRTCGPQLGLLDDDDDVMLIADEPQSRIKLQLPGPLAYPGQCKGHGRRPFQCSRRRRGLEQLQQRAVALRLLTRSGCISISQTRRGEK